MTSVPLDTAVRCLQSGGVIAYPTEAVFGIGCDPLQQQAVERLLAIKKRAVSKGLLLIGANFDQLAPWVRLADEQARALRQHWPFATTYLIEASDKVPDWISGGRNKVGVRVVGNPVAAALCERFGSPLVSTSANLSGRQEARSALQVRRQLGDQLDLIVEGNCDQAGKPSTIIDLATGAVIRA